MKIGICGAGWLGQPLALELHHQGHLLTVSKRTEQGVKSMLALGLQAKQFCLGDDLTHPTLLHLFNNDVLILNIAPGRRHLNVQHFIQSMRDLLEHARANGTQQLIFISTTSVYGNQAGIISETTSAQPQTASAKAHLCIEAMAKDIFQQQVSILRLAGLVGEDRHPIRTLAGKQLSNGSAAVNLIHRRDVIAAIQALLTKALFAQTFHLCAQQHPSRKDYYTWCAQQLGLTHPQFDEHEQPTAKQVDASHSLHQLGITLAYPSPYDMLKGLSLSHTG